MESRKALINYVIGNEFISKPELQQKFIKLLNKHEQALQLQQTGVIKSVCGNCERKQLYIKKQCYCGYCGDRLKT